MAAGWRAVPGGPVPVIPRLHLVTDDQVLSEAGFTSAARAALIAGAGRVTFQLRGPRSSGRRLWETAKALQPLAADQGVPLIVNDRVDLALVIPSAGAHLGARSIPTAAARGLLGRAALIGHSVHSVREATRILSETDASLDYLVAGSLFPTASHPDRASVGLELLHALRSVFPDIPLIGIGGVTSDRIPDVIAAGGHGVAVIGAVWRAPDTAEAVRELLEAIDRSISKPEAGTVLA